MELPDNFKGNVIDRVYKDFCKLIRLVGPKGEFYGEFPLDITSEEDMAFERIPYGMELVPVDTDIRDSDTITSITPQFWTCNCRSKFVRHIGDCSCLLCGTHINNSVERLPPVQFLAEPEWASHIGNAFIRHYDN